MKSGPIMLGGLFAAVVISWSGIVLGSHLQLGRLTPFYDDGDGQAYPYRQTGRSARGQLVYADLGCGACHTQQVRRPEYGSDQARGWGERQTVARDYIFQARPQLGFSRFGPDLTNLAGRKPQAPSEEALYRLLYQGSATHPAYPFLFEQRSVAGETSALALKVAGTPSGQQIVPTDRAQSLVAHLLNLNTAYDYPESRPLPKAELQPKAEPSAAKPEVKK